MKSKEKLEEEVEFWFNYISDWEANHNEPIPNRAQLLLDNALLKLEGHYSGKKYDLVFQCNNHTIH